jgi:hypothetical protein
MRFEEEEEEEEGRILFHHIIGCNIIYSLLSGDERS